MILIISRLAFPTTSKSALVAVNHIAFTTLSFFNRIPAILSMVLLSVSGLVLMRSALRLFATFASVPSPTTMSSLTRPTGSLTV